MTVDPRTFRLVVVFVGIALLGCIGGIIGLSAVKTAVPDVLVALGGTIVGYFGGLFTNPHSSNDPTPVTIADEPVQVTTTPRKTTKRRAAGDSGELGVILVILLVLLLVFGGAGFAVHALWWLLIVVLVLAGFALLTGRR